MAFVFRIQTPLLKDFTKIYQLKGLKPKNEGHTNFYECCDLTEKSISKLGSLGALSKGNTYLVIGVGAPNEKQGKMAVEPDSTSM